MVFSGFILEAAKGLFYTILIVLETQFHSFEKYTDEFWFDF
jgi:hypothetical protein